MLTKSQIQTPYGKIQTLTVLADGISRFYAEKEMTITEGVALSPERNQQIPAFARHDDGLYAGIDRFIADVVFADELSALIGDPWGPRLLAKAENKLGEEKPELFDALMAQKHTFPKAAPSGDDHSPEF